MPEQNKFVLIIDGNEVVADYRANEVFDNLGIGNSEITRAKNFSERARGSLFGGTIATRLNLESKNDVQSMVKILEDYKKNDKKLSFVGDAFVIVIHKIDRRGTKKLENLCSDLDAQLVVSKANDATSTVDSLLSELYLQNDVKDFLKHHVGNSVERLIPVMRIVEKLPKRQQQKISVEDLLLRISPKEGEVEPWGIEDAIMKGNTTEAITQFRRVSNTSSFLIPLSILKKNFTNLHTILMLKADGISDNKKLASITGMSAAQVGFVSRNKATKLTIDRSLKILELIAEYEHKVKGGESTDPQVNTEILITRLCLFFK